MADLTDHNMERLSHLFASGNMRHAREIARLLNLEPTTELCAKAYPRSSLLEDFLHGLARFTAGGGYSSTGGGVQCGQTLARAERPIQRETLVGVLLYRANKL
jgi:hypothetical protein